MQVLLLRLEPQTICNKFFIFLLCVIRSMLRNLFTKAMNNFVINKLVRFSLTNTSILVQNLIESLEPAQSVLPYVFQKSLAPKLTFKYWNRIDVPESKTTKLIAQQCLQKGKKYILLALAIFLSDNQATFSQEVLSHSRFRLFSFQKSTLFLFYFVLLQNRQELTANITVV